MRILLIKKKKNQMQSERLKQSNTNTNPQLSVIRKFAKIEFKISSRPSLFVGLFLEQPTRLELLKIYKRKCTTRNNEQRLSVMKEKTNYYTCPSRANKITKGEGERGQ
jgi:hypothetical protein